MIHLQLLVMAALIVFSLVLVVVTIYLHPEKADNLQPLQSDHILNVVSPIFWNYWIDFLKKEYNQLMNMKKFAEHINY